MYLFANFEFLNSEKNMHTHLLNRTIAQPTSNVAYDEDSE